LFYGASIAATILVFNRDKKEASKGKVLIVAAEEEYQEGKNQNTLREKDVEKIVSTCETYQDMEKYARVVTLEEIKENDYNLNISRYIDKSVEEDLIDIPSVLTDIETIEIER